ncbi:MAG: hybrid sensor histidine kinase/response regulator [Herminiimonas sp.]|nr:hybrid sensor histidine kinase/response regulator [Herminiimonas sp.]
MELDLTGHITSWNAGAHRLFGYEPMEISGKSIALLYTAEDQAAGLPAEALRSVVAEGKSTLEGCRVRKDGSRFQARITIEAVWDKKGRVAGFAEVTRDMDEGRIPRVAPTHDEQFQQLVEGVATQAIYLLSPSGSVVTWNSGAERITGYSAAEVIGIDFSRFHTEQDRELETPKNALQTAAREGYFESEGWRIRKDGSDFLAYTVIHPLHDHSGTLTGFAEVTRDITGKNRLAQERDEARASLLRLQKIEAMAQLAGGIAHDFNSLLAAVGSNLEQLGHDFADIQNAASFTAARKSLDRGLKLTRQLQTFANGEPGPAEKVNLNRAIEGNEADWRQALRDRITLRTRFGRNLPPVYLDSKLFARVMRALVVGVHRVMPGGGRIELSTEDARLPERRHSGERLPRNGIRIVLRYSGAGLTPDLIERALPAAFDQGPTDAVDGADVGMARLYAFVAEANGDITIQSRPDAGGGIPGAVEVVMHFPPAPEGMDLVERSAEEVTAIPYAPGTALIVEDEPDVLAISTELFRSLGYNVLTAESGLEAVDILRRSQQIDVLFTDVVMPRGMSGVSLARLTAEIRPNTRVILASGYPMSVIVKDHGDIANFNFISKPYRWSELVERLKAPAAPAGH